MRDGVVGHLTDSNIKVGLSLAQSGTYGDYGNLGKGHGLPF
jgi:hypothetical protein